MTTKNNQKLPIFVSGSGIAAMNKFCQVIGLVNLLIPLTGRFETEGHFSQVK